MKLKKSMLPRLDAFKREYIGDEVDGRRTMMVFFFCRVPADWARRVIIAHDGGDCFFDVQYDPIRRRYLSFMVHGNSYPD
jgi:hypothetical protein